MAWASTAAGTPRVLYEDDWLLAADKPAGVIVHGDGTGARTLTDDVRAYVAERHGDAAARELQALQRLDRDTTGIVLFSLSKRTQAAFDRLIAARAIKKRYLAIVRGRAPAAKTMRQPLGRDRHDSRRMRVSRTGKPAHTEAVRLACTQARGGSYSLLAVDLHTGRKHQIRVHLAHAGFPLVGDTLYGGAPSRAGLMLHAAELAFTHPVTGEPVHIRTPWPARFNAWFSETQANTRQAGTRQTAGPCTGPSRTR